MFDHVTIRVSDRDASERFYTLVLGSIGIERTSVDEQYPEWDDFSISQADGRPATTGLHLGFVAGSRDDVDEFWRTGVDAGYPSDGEPGPRPEYRDDYYGAFLLDPDGNSAEAVHHGVVREPGFLDHLWIRVSDVEASQRFYELVAKHAGLRFRGTADDPYRAQFVGAGGSFSLVQGEATAPFHLAFPTDENAKVDAFHAAMLAAGYRDNGAPGERPVYHEGYYGAYVLDPDGHNVELVNHNR